ncbi:hypothetical protein BV898_04142 [Hypsibius exemplaris]|uniref:NR LBD domain-containing protein n=1 Tax=Hypsibius exemplaris TaxID=2072580 RepID=A0A1W0X354_HYPEX|nr:hypothetical protein BV898_04142 [Hypsibius exemplaris]
MLWIHQSPYITEQETFVKIGPLMEYHWTNKWQHSIAEPELLRFFQQFLKQFKEIGLTQTEHYLLLIVIMLEPVRTMRTTGSGRRTQGELIHKYYGDVLIHTLKRRIADPVELASTCRKITELFGTLGLLNRIHRYYLRSLTDRATPSRAVANERTVTVQEAISYGDHGEPVEESEEFNFFSPMTFNPRLVISTGRNSDSRLPDFQIASENET